MATANANANTNTAAADPAPFDADSSPPAPTSDIIAAHGETITLEEWLASHEQESDQIPMADVTFRNYNEGQYICFTRYDHLPWIYGIIAAGGISDTGGGGKTYPFIYYCDNTQINTNSFPNDNIARAAQEPTTVITSLDEKILENKLYYFLKYKPDDTAKMIYYTREAEEIPEGIRNILHTEYIKSRYSNLISSSRESSRDSSRDSPSVSRYSNYSPAVSRSTSSRGSSVGGKKYRKRKNKTKRRNRKTKRRNNRKTKKR